MIECKTTIDSKFDTIVNRTSNTTTRPQSYQRLFLFSNGVLKITPKIEVPFELTGSVESGFTLGLPITVRFQSQFQLMSDWIKQVIANRHKGVSTKNKINISLGASLARILLANINSVTNVGEPEVVDQSSSTVKSGGLNSTIHTHSTGTVTGQRTVPIDRNSTIGTNRNPKHIIGATGADHLDNHKAIVENELVKSHRSFARAQLYQSFTISHSRFGKSCLQRAICEVSQTPLMTPNGGLIGQLIDSLLTLDSLYEDFIDDFSDFITAQTIGRESYEKQLPFQTTNDSFIDECLITYGNLCPFSLFNIIHI